MNFEDELTERLQDAASDLTIPGGSLSHIQERSQARQRRRQIATRAGSVSALVAVVFVVGLVVLQQDSDNQTIGTAGSTLVDSTDVAQGPEDSASSGGADSDLGDAGADDGAGSPDADQLTPGAQGPVLPLELQPSGFEEWQQVLSPGQSAETVRFDFTGGAVVAQVGSDWYVDNGNGWQRLALPDAVEVMAIDAHNSNRLVVAGMLAADECESHMAVATLEDNVWAIRRVPSGLMPGVRSHPLTAEVRSAGNGIVLSTAEQLSLDPLCLIRNLVASSSTGAVNSEAGDGSGGAADGAGDDAGNAVPDAALGDLVVQAWDIALEGAQPLSLAEVVDASVEDFGIKVTTTSGDEFFIPLDELSNLRPLDTQFQALVASARVSDNWHRPLDAQVEAMLDAHWVVRVSHLAGASPATDNTWYIKNLEYVNNDERPFVAAVASLGVVEDEVITTHAGQQIAALSSVSAITGDEGGSIIVTEIEEFGPEDFEEDGSLKDEVLQEGSSQDDILVFETQEPRADLLSPDVQFAVVRDGFVTATQIPAAALNPASSGVAWYLDVVQFDGQEVAVVVDDGETTVMAGGQRWALEQLCGFDSRWARLGIVGDQLRLITFADGQPELYQLALAS